MIIAVRILQKILINYFYKVNAGFFLFIFFVLFGLPNSIPAFHLSLLSGIIQSQVFLGAVMLVWLFYNLKCADYMHKQLRDPRQSFLFCFNNLPGKKIYKYMLYVHLAIYMPVLIYACFIVWFAIIKHQYWCAVETIAFNTIIVSVTAFTYFITLQKKDLSGQKFLLPQIKISLPKPFFSIPLYFLWHDRADVFKGKFLLNARYSSSKALI